MVEEIQNSRLTNKSQSKVPSEESRVPSRGPADTASALSPQTFKNFSQRLQAPGQYLFDDIQKKAVNWEHFLIVGLARKEKEKSRQNTQYVRRTSWNTTKYVLDSLTEFILQFPICIENENLCRNAVERHIIGDHSIQIIEKQYAYQHDHSHGKNPLPQDELKKNKGYIYR